MATVEVEHVSKNFGSTQAVADVSFTVEGGEIFGLLGPNGAGKTTIIRLMLDIFKPDSGQIAILGGPMSEAKKERIGYMPEERGLYQDVSLERCLVYMATLKGLDSQEARRRVQDYLERFALVDYRSKQVKSLSKGMQQKAQIIVTLLHEPELVIVDEPFNALDPVNTQMVKGLLREMRQRGATIIMSTHQMHPVEELCDRILLIDHGATLLYGDLGEIRRQFSGHAVLVQSPQALPELPGISGFEIHNAAYKIDLLPGTTPEDILRELVVNKVLIERFEIAVPTLDEIFIDVVQERRKG